MHSTVLLIVSGAVALGSGAETLPGPCPEPHPGHVDQSEIRFGNDYNVVITTVDNAFYPGRCITDTKYKFSENIYSIIDGELANGTFYETVYLTDYFEQDDILFLNVTVLDTSLSGSLPTSLTGKVLYTSENLMITSPCRMDGDQHLVEGAALSLTKTITPEEKDTIMQIFANNGIPEKYLKLVDQTNCTEQT